MAASRVGRVAGVLFGLLGGAATFASVGPSRVVVSRDAAVMGTRVTLATHAVDRVAGLQRLDRFLRIIEDTDRELSTWKADSQLSLLNRQPVGRPFTLNADLCHLFGALRTWQHESSGAFDPAIGALVDLWGLRGRGAIPTAEAVTRTLATSGLRHLRFDGHRCTVTRTADVTVDAGAFGKGEALDRVRRAARGVDDPWVIDLGGQVVAHGRPFGRDGWTVDVAHPGDRATPVFHVELSDGSVAVSGGSERDLDVGGTRVGHILDPHSGAPATGGLAVVVWDAQALTADIVSTALYVMGPDAGLAWADARGLAACFLIAGPGQEVGTAVVGRASDAFIRTFGSVCGAAG